MTATETTPRPTVDGAKLRLLRFERGLTLTMLAGQAESSIQHLCDMEHGRRNAKPPVLARIAAVLGCKVSDLLQGPVA